MIDVDVELAADHLEAVDLLPVVEVAVADVVDVERGEAELVGAPAEERRDLRHDRLEGRLGVEIVGEIAGRPPEIAPDEARHPVGRPHDDLGVGSSARPGGARLAVTVVAGRQPEGRRDQGDSKRNAQAQSTTHR